MSAPIRISLHPGEKVFVNGAVLRVDRKVSMEFLNDVSFLLENHVLQPEQATTPLRQLYFVVQTMLMDPRDAEQAAKLFRQMHAGLLSVFENPEVASGLKFVDGMVRAGRYFEALKNIRALFALEERILASKSMPVPANANVLLEAVACK